MNIVSLLRYYQFLQYQLNKANLNIEQKQKRKDFFFVLRFDIVLTMFERFFSEEIVKQTLHYNRLNYQDEYYQVVT